MRQQLCITIILLTLLLASGACSSGTTPVEPQTGDEINFSVAEENNRTIVGVWHAAIDPDNKTFNIEPAQRTGDYHFPLTSLYPDVVEIVSYNFGPPFTAEIRISHPMSGSGIDGYDPRVIAVLPANPGVSMNYPELDVNANKSVLLYPDGYTKLWDDPLIQGNANPFIAYFEVYPHRTWSSTGVTSETQLWQMDLSGFGGPIIFDLIVDVSTNFPNPSEPVIGNAPEPVWLDAEIGEGLTSDGGFAGIEVTLIDWQGELGIGGVVVESPGLFNGIVNLGYIGSGGTDKYIFNGTIPNELIAPAGEYPVLVAAWDQATGVYLYDEFTANVEQVIIGLKDVTPPWLNLSPYSIQIDGNTVYTVYREGEVNVFDITDPLNPTWLTNVEIPEEAGNIFVDGDFAFVSCYENGVAVLNVSNPEFTNLYDYIDVSGSASDVFAKNSYLYVACGNGLKIYNVQDIANPVLLKTVLTGAGKVTVYNGYAYVSDMDDIRVIDVDPVETAEVIHSVHTSSHPGRIAIRASYAYVCTSSNGVIVLDISDPSSASIVEQVSTGTPFDISISSNYLYVPTALGLTIVDIHSPENIFLVLQMQELGWCMNVDTITQQYAFVTNKNGIAVIDISTPESAFWSNSIGSLYNATNVSIDNGYAYVTTDNSTLQIIDIDPFDSFHFANVGPRINTSEAMDAADGVAAVAYDNSGGFLYVVDINPPESAEYVWCVTMSTSYTNALEIRSGYAYLVSEYYGITIVDVDPPVGAFEAVNLDHTERLKDICLDGDYAYCACRNDGLVVFDVEPILDTNLVKTVPMPENPKAIQVLDGYAYIADYLSGLQIIDIDPINDAYIVHSVATPGPALDIFISGKMAFVACETDGLSLIDITTPESAYIVDTLAIPGIVKHVEVYQNQAYVIKGDETMMIIELW